MPGGLPQPVVLDATVPSNFASTDAIDYLVEVLESPAVTPAVRDELEDGWRSGHGFLGVAVEEIGEGLTVLEPSDEHPELRDRLDAGEAASIAGAVERGGSVATDDLAARRVADELGLTVTGSVGLLVLGIERGQLDVATADDWLETCVDDEG